jgi:hypothetical protein
MPNVYQLSTYCHNGAGNFFQNVFHFELSEAGSGVAPFDYADGLISTWITNNEPKYIDLFGNDVVLDYYAAKRITGGGGPSATRASGTVGTGSTVSASSGSAVDIQWQTASPLNRPGHTYVPGFPYSSLQGDAFTSGYLTKVGAFITQMQTNLTLAGAMGNAVFSIYTRKTTTAYQVNNGQARPKATMMNRRLLPQI